MNQNKAQFIFDYYVEIREYSKLRSATHVLQTEGILHVVEPWPGNMYRLYVRKDQKAALEILEDTVLK